MSGALRRRKARPPMQRGGARGEGGDAGGGLGTGGRGVAGGGGGVSARAGGGVERALRADGAWWRAVVGGAGGLRRPPAAEPECTKSCARRSSFASGPTEPEWSSPANHDGHALAPRTRDDRRGGPGAISGRKG